MKKILIAVIALIVLCNSIFVFLYLNNSRERGKSFDKTIESLEKAAIEYLDEQINKEIEESEMLIFQVERTSFVASNEKNSYPYEKAEVSLRGGKNKFDLFFNRYKYVVIFEANDSGELEIVGYDDIDTRNRPLCH